MKVAVVAPEPSSGVRGGTERAVDAIVTALNHKNDVEACAIKLTVDESSLSTLVDAYERFSHLDLGSYDRIVSVKYPAWMAPHPNHVVYLFHPLRGLYDTYHLFRLPNKPTPESAHARRLIEFIERNSGRGALFEFFGQFDALRRSVAPDHPDLAFPGPIARAIVHWLDAIALAPTQITKYFALSRTVAARSNYFPQEVVPRVLTMPGSLPTPTPQRALGNALFTASRLDGPKRIELIIDAMTHVQADIPLRIAGTGPAEHALRERAAHDKRIEFLGYVSDSELAAHYQEAIAVPFVPFDEDLGLIPLEAASQATPIVTVADAGGPTEFVADGVNGLIVAPTPSALGSALNQITADPAWARRMGIAAHRKASTYRWSDVADALTATDQVIETHRQAVSGRRPVVISLATYGIDRPAHGGQLRVNHLCQALAQTMDVHVLALDANAQHTTTTTIAPGLECTIVARDPRQSRIEDTLGIQAAQPVTDIMSGINAHLTKEFTATLANLAREADLVILEQPFLYPALDHAGIDLPIVVNTQNVEWDMRASTLAPSRIRRELLDMVGQIEAHALKNATAITACSPDDASRLASLYALDEQRITLIPNGTNVPTTVPTLVERSRAATTWLRRFGWNRQSSEAKQLGVFFGSWHLPNIDAAEFLVELADANPDLFIVSAGNHAQAFEGRHLPTNIVFPGPVSERTKQALLASATVALNPMRTGSGTNLKIIEFLAHGVPTVSTPFGARGLGLVDREHLILASPNEFASAIRQTASDPIATQQRIDSARRFITAYDWQVIGGNYRDLVGHAIAPRQQATAEPIATLQHRDG